YLPRALVARLIAQQGALPAAEDRAITILFCDLEGYTPYPPGRPATETATYLNDLMARVGPAIEATGGTIDKYMGDGLMAFWGAPEPNAQHARAACLGALSIAHEVEAFNRARRLHGLPPPRPPRPPPPPSPSRPGPRPSWRSAVPPASPPAACGSACPPGRSWWGM